MKAVIFTGGSYNHPAFYDDFIKNMGDVLVICADSGADVVVDAGLLPHYLVGDMDSLCPAALKACQAGKTQLLKHPTHKDETDTELAVSLCISKAVKEVTILGAMGDRFDHSFGNIHLLNTLRAAGIFGRIVDEKNCVFLVAGEKKLSIPIGTTVSVMPYTDLAQGVDLEGFEYPVQGGEMDHYRPGYGISNVTVALHQRIFVETGILLVDVITKGGE